MRSACHGGCPKDRFATSPYGEPGQHYLCPGYKDFFHHVREPMQQMTALLRVGRAPAELMSSLRQTRRPARPQRPVPLRRRPQMEALPRHRTRPLKGSLAALRRDLSAVGLSRLNVRVSLVPPATSLCPDRRQRRGSGAEALRLVGQEWMVVVAGLVEDGDGELGDFDEGPGRSFSGSETTTWARFTETRSRSISGYTSCSEAMSAEWNRVRVCRCDEYRKAQRMRPSEMATASLPSRTSPI